MFLSLFLFFACGEQAKECEPCPKCPSADAGDVNKETATKSNAAGSSLSEKERTLLKPYLDDIREGIRPFNEKGIGICKGLDRTCPEFLGTEVGDLPEGEYQPLSHSHYVHRAQSSLSLAPRASVEDAVLEHVTFSPAEPAALAG